MFSSHRRHPRQFAWAIYLICFVLLAIRISGVHTHQHIELAHSGGAAAFSEIHNGDGHQSKTVLLHADHADLHDHHGDSVVDLSDVVHQYFVEIDTLTDVFGKTSKLSHEPSYVLALMLLWQLLPAPLNVIPSFIACVDRPQAPRLRPPSCGPPKFFIA